MLLLFPAPLQQAQKYSTLIGTGWKQEQHYHPPLPMNISLVLQLYWNIDRNTVFTLSPLPLGSSHPPAVTVVHLTDSHGLMSQSWPTEICSKLRPFSCYWNINKQEVLQGQGTWASDLHISKAKCLLLLLAASGSLQTTYLHLRNSYLVLQTHQRFTLTQKNSLVRSEETMKKSSFSYFFCQMSVKAFLKGVYLIFSHVTLYIQLLFQKENKTKLCAQMQTNLVSAWSA